MKELSTRQMDFLGWFEKYKEEYKLEEIKVRDNLKEWRKEMKDIRLEWLNTSILYLEKQIKNAYLNDGELRKQHKPYWFRMTILEALRNTHHNEMLFTKYTHERLMLSNPIINISNKIDIQTIKDNININSIITLNKAEFCICPFHIDKTPSMKWYPKTQSLHCFSCGWHGDIISFLMERDGLTFKEVINKLK